MGSLQQILDFLKQDPVTHFEALYHLKHGQEATRFWFEEPSFLIELPSARKFFLGGDPISASALLHHLEFPNYLVHTFGPLLPCLKHLFTVREVQLNFVYTLQTENFYPQADARVRPLIPRGSPISYNVGEEKISLETFYGLFLEDQLVCYGGTQFEDEEWAEIAWLRTEEAHQRRGYGVKVVSAIVEDLLRERKKPVYRVTADNVSSRRLAEKLGFNLHSEFLYVTVRQ